MTRRLTKTHCILALIGVGATVGTVVILWLYGWRNPPPAMAPVFPLPSLSPTEFLNTEPGVAYIGAAACAKCHADRHASYLLTAHSQALADLDCGTEPPDGAFEHKASGRSYRVYRRDNRMYHEEVVRTSEGKEIARLDVPIRYRIGSGNFTRSYMVEIDGFLHESPITWYASTKKWAMSPGYDEPQNEGFERPIAVVCLRCHAGRVEAAADTMHRIILHEKVIGCESCHGPGALHQDLHRSRTGRQGGADDPTIVNPGKLDRTLQEAICATCHLEIGTAVAVRGHDRFDFRPGMPLTDYRVDYRLDTPGNKMTVVGHIGQLHRSACYQKSQTMTCLTCHKQHLGEKPRDPVVYYRQKCLSCHTTEACHLSVGQRQQKDATDNCVACHMPRGDTEIPHIAFTHHHIGRHGQPEPDSDTIPELVPIYDVSHLPPLDRRRNLGMAYMLAAKAHAKFADVFQARAKNLLDAVESAGLCDDAMAASLTEIYQVLDRERARKYARQLADSKTVVADTRCEALFYLANCAMQDGDDKTAVGLLEKLVLLRRRAHDWEALAVNYLKQEQPLKALPAFHQALAIRPYRATNHFGMRDAYRLLGDFQHAIEHQEKGLWLRDHDQD